jgi:protein TonB
MRANESGLVDTLLSIDSSGAVADCRVIGTSHSRWLDEKTCAIFKQRTHFHPAIDDQGRPVAAPYFTGLGWYLPRR